MKPKRVVNARRPNDQRERPHWISGINAIARRIEVNPGSIRELLLAGGESGRRTPLAAAAAAARIAVRDSDAATLHRLTGSDHHQGVAALADPIAYHDLEQIVSGTPGPLLVLDQIQDPHNFGALIRTAAAVGMAAIVIPRHGAVGVSAAVEKVSAGAVNDVPICCVTNLRRCLLDLRPSGYWSIGLTPRAEQDLFALDMPERPALVLGGETGLRHLVEEACDFRARIPLRPGVESLNASVAGAVAMYEVVRRLSGRPPGP